jgi:hypothetical protein
MNGKVDYLREGFILHWDEQGLTLEVIDYHATTLTLSWKDVRSLAKLAGAPPTAGSRPSRRTRREDPPPSP